MATEVKAPTDLQLGVEFGVDRSLYFRWTWNQNHTDHYEVWWEYTTGNKITINKKATDIWFTGSETNVNAKIGISTYTYPNNATKVRVRVKAVATKHKVGDKDEPYWICPYTKVVNYTVPTTNAGIAGDSFPHAVSALEVKPEKSSNRTLHATWMWTKAYTDYFEVKWLYSDGTAKKDGSRLWFVGAIDQVIYNAAAQEGNEHGSTFNVPQGATLVRCRVQPFSRIKEQTSTLIRYFWVAKYTAVNYTYKTTETKKDKVKNLTTVVQNGTSRTLIAMWDWEQTPTEHFNVEWQYTSGDKSGNSYIWLDGGSSTTSIKRSTYTIPDNGIKARVRVQPVCGADPTGYVAWKVDFGDYTESVTIPAGNNKQAQVKMEPELNSESSLIASWTWDYHSSTDHYEVTWKYTTGNTDANGNRIWLEGEAKTTTERSTTFSYPANAATVLVRVLPIAKASQWIAKVSADVKWNVPDTSEASVTKSKKTVNIESIDRQRGTARTVIAQWTWGGTMTSTDHYEVDWRYLVKTSGTSDSNGVYVRESIRSTANADILYDLYDVPANTDTIELRVRPVAKTHKVQNIETPYWTADWCAPTRYSMLPSDDVDALEPPTPSVPSVFINGLTLTAELNIYDEGADVIEFEVVKDDTESFITGRSKIIYNHAEMRFTVAIGGEYKVRARSLRPIGKNTIDTIIADATPGNSELSPWSEFSENVGTVPATPIKIISHDVISPEEINLVWDEVLNVTGYTIEYALNSDYFDRSDQVTSISTGPSTSRYINGLDSGNTYYVRVCAVNGKGESGWTPIYSFVVGTRPSAPTTWSDTTKAIIGDKIYMYWMHNSEDESSQRQAEVELTINNGDPVIVEPTYLGDGSIPSYYVFDSVLLTLEAVVDAEANTLLDSEGDTIYTTTYSTQLEGSEIRWRVRTKGVVDQWSPWSTQRLVTLYSEPTLTLYVGNNEEHNDRAYEITKYPLLIYAEAFPKNQNALGYSITIISNESYESTDKFGNSISVRDQQVIYNQYVPATNGNILDIQLLPSDVNLDNTITYTVSVSVAMDSGLSGSNNWTFTARWDDTLLVPDAEITINKNDLCAYIRPFCEDGMDGFANNVLLSVYRIEYDGRYIQIAENLPNGEATIVDPHPSLNYARYRVVAMNEYTGEIGFRDIPGIPVGETAIVIQWDEDWKSFNTSNGLVEGEFADPVHNGSTLKLPYNVETSDSTDVDVVLNEYIGRSHPVSYYGTQLGIKGDWNAVIPRDDIPTIYALRRLAIYRGDVYVREPSGVGYWANLTVSFSKRYSDMTIPVSLTVTRVEGGI